MANTSSIAHEDMDASVVGVADRSQVRMNQTNARKLGTDRLIDQRQLPPERDLPLALTKHGLRGDWESLMAEVERRGWYVIPATPLTDRLGDTPAPRRVYVGMISNESHVTVDGNGATIIEALGWAVVNALDATDRAETN